MIDKWIDDLLSLWGQCANSFPVPSPPETAPALLSASSDLTRRNMEEWGSTRGINSSCELAGIKYNSWVRFLETCNSYKPVNWNGLCSWKTVIQILLLPFTRQQFNKRLKKKPARGKSSFQPPRGGVSAILDMKNADRLGGNSLRHPGDFKPHWTDWHEFSGIWKPHVLKNISLQYNFSTSWMRITFLQNRFRF